MSDIDKVKDDFLSGNMDDLRNRICPYCNQIGLLFTVSKALTDAQAVAGRRYRAGMNIYCRAQCNTLIAHMDGYCPAWAEEINDWQEFSDGLISS